MGDRQEKRTIVKFHFDHPRDGYRHLLLAFGKDAINPGGQSHQERLAFYWFI
jgi:hypothetical protein